MHASILTSERFGKQVLTCASLWVMCKWVTCTYNKAGSAHFAVRCPTAFYVHATTREYTRLNRTHVARRLLYVSDSGIPDGIKVDESGRMYTGYDTSLAPLAHICIFM